MHTALPSIALEWLQRHQTDDARTGVCDGKTPDTRPFREKRAGIRRVVWKDLSEDLGVWIYWTTKDELNVSCFGKNVDHVLKL